MTVQVQGDAVHISSRGFHRSDSRPSLEGPNHGVLRQVFRFTTTPGKQVQRTDQPRVFGPEERLEFDLCPLPRRATNDSRADHMERFLHWPGSLQPGEENAISG
jgi:hypothetical protein